MPVPEEDFNSTKAANFYTSWTAFNTYWNPLEKGQYSANYELTADLDGRLFEREFWSNQKTFSYIIDTDYSTYFVEYACKQQFSDFWTIEYVDIFTKDGEQMSEVYINSLKAKLKTWAPNFDTDTLVASRSGKMCAFDTVWGIF